MPNHHRRTDQSPTQTVEGIECPVCGEHVTCCVQYGLYDGIVTPCLLNCHTDSDFPQDELEARAITAALVERHDYEWSARDLCGADDR